MAHCVLSALFGYVMILYMTWIGCMCYSVYCMCVSHLASACFMISPVIV
jgi:hypothetical protein